MHKSIFEILKMPLYAGKYAICAFLQNMLRSHDRYKPVYLVSASLNPIISFNIVLNSCIKLVMNLLC